MSDFVPPSPKSISLRPLTKGMVSNASVGEDGAKVVRNLVVQPNGLERRAAWTPMFGDKTSFGRIEGLEEGEVVQDVVPYWAEDGDFMYVAITNKRLWKLGSASTTWEPIPFVEASYVATSRDSTHLNVAGATFLSDGVRIGDRAIVDALTDTTHVLLTSYALLSNIGSSSDTADGLQIVTSAEAATFGAFVGPRGTSWRYGLAQDTYIFRVRLDSGTAGTYQIQLKWYVEGVEHTTTQNVTLSTGAWNTVTFDMSSVDDYDGELLTLTTLVGILACYPCTFTIAYTRCIFPFEQLFANKSGAFGSIGNIASLTNTVDGVSAVMDAGAASGDVYCAMDTTTYVGAAGDVFIARIRLDSGAEGLYSIGAIWQSSRTWYHSTAEYTLLMNDWVEIRIVFPNDATYADADIALIGLFIEHPFYPVTITIESVNVQSNRSSVAITSVAETALTFASLPTAISDTFTIERRFALEEESDLADFTFTPAYLVLTDNSVGGLVKFDGDVLTSLGVHAATGDPDTDYLQAARTVMYFAGRLWLGCTNEVGSNGRRFVRWSSLTDITEFAAVDYVDLYGEDSSVFKLSKNENVPLVYMENAIYTGYPSTLEGLPYAFVRVERGSISLAGPRAVASAGGGQFFVSSDNFYFLSTGREGTAQTVSCESIGTPIVDEAVERSQSLLRSQVFYDKQRELVYFALPSSTSTLWRIFVFSLRTKAWSYFDTPSAFFVALAVLPAVISATDWSDLDATTWDQMNGVAWGSLETRISQADVCAIDVNGTAYRQDRGALNDSLYDAAGDAIVASAIDTEYVSADLEFDAPDIDKVFTRVVVSVDDSANIVRSNDAVFDVSLSETHGRTWVDKGTLTIEAGSNEDEAHFRFRSDVARIRLTCEQTPPLILSDVVVRVRPGELHNVR